MAASIFVSARRLIPSSRLLYYSGPLVLPAILVLPLLLSAPFFTEPFERDEGAYATIAQGILQGEVPYRDLFDHKPPLIYAWYALSFLLFGEGIVAPRLMAALVWAMTTFLVYKQGELLFGQRIARTGALIFALSSALVLLQANANTEAYMLLPLTLSLYAFTRALDSPSPGWLLVAGAAGGFAFFTKQVAAVSVALALLFLAVYWWKSVEFPELGKRYGSIVLGFVLVSLAVLVPFALAGALDDFIYANWTYNRLYAAAIPLGERVSSEIVGLSYFILTAGPLVLLGLAGAFGSLRRKMPGNILLVAWLAGAYGGVVLSGRAFPHYYVTLLPPLALLAGAGLTRMPLSGGKAWGYRGVLAFMAVLSLGLNAGVYLEPTPEQKHIARFGRDEDAFLSLRPVRGSYRLEDLARHNASPRLADYFRSITGPSDRIYNYGRETQVYFYADRLPANRFIYDRPFWLDPATLEIAVAELRAAKPAVIFDSVSSRSDPGWNETHPPSLRKLLKESYEYLGEVEFADVYRLKEKHSPAASSLRPLPIIQASGVDDR